MIRRMSPVKPLSEILAAMQSKNESDIALVSKAYAFAEKAHADQKRYSGEPYFGHIAHVGHSIAEIGMDAETVAAGLLHDTVEDAHISEKTIEEEFGATVRHLVHGVTKLGALKYRGVERHTES